MAEQPLIPQDSPAQLLATAATAALGIRVPVLQAPVGSATSVELAAAVSEAGALGMLALTWRDISQIRLMLREAVKLTARPVAVNLVLEWDMRERLEVCLEEGVRLFSFFWGDPAPYLPAVHETGGVVLQTVGSVPEAQRAVAAGVDFLVAQGAEAGGHVRGTVSTMVLVPSIVDAVGESVPVIAAGGIADGRGLAAALMLGAAGVMIGTRFLLAEEADVHRAYAEALCRAAPEDAIYTTLFEEGWPNAPHRVLANSTLREWEAAGSPPKGSRPGEGEPVAWQDGMPLLRYSDSIPRRSTAGAVEQLAMYAGQSVGLARRREPAAVIVESIRRQALETLAGGTGRRDSDGRRDPVDERSRT
jgi:NAD(P)H-dependent flavin oxidoreductase YrpB (nitropropane dioxygenase family)